MADDSPTGGFVLTNVTDQRAECSDVSKVYIIIPICLYGQIT